MPNNFDTLKAKMFRDVTAVMGFEAFWLSASTGAVTLLPSKVTFKKPSLKEKQFIEYDDAFWEAPNRVMEYLEADIPGLFDLINASQEPETAERFQVDGIYYYAGSARRMFDGDLVYVQLFLDE